MPVNKKENFHFGVTAISHSMVCLDCKPCNTQCWTNYCNMILF